MPRGKWGASQGSWLSAGGCELLAASSQEASVRPGSFPSHQWAALNVDPLLVGASAGLLAAAARTGAELGCVLARAGFVSSLHASLDQLRGRVQLPSQRPAAGSYLRYAVPSGSSPRCHSMAPQDCGRPLLPALLAAQADDPGDSLLCFQLCSSD